MSSLKGWIGLVGWLLSTTFSLYDVLGTCEVYPVLHRYRGGRGFKFPIEASGFLGGFICNCLVTSQLQRSLSLLCWIHVDFLSSPHVVRRAYCSYSLSFLPSFCVNNLSSIDWFYMTQVNVIKFVCRPRFEPVTTELSGKIHTT